MDKAYLQTWSRTLRERGLPLEPGLSDAEISMAERTYGFLFPQDLKALLQEALPAGGDFPNWRSEEDAGLRKLLSWPMEGLCLDVEHNGFWLASWGPKPPDVREAISRCQHLVAGAPPLVPIFSHRYIPADPLSEGGPVLSVHQSDIIYYGNDLADYFHNEFRVPLPGWAAKAPRQVRFWDEIVADNSRPASPHSRGPAS